MFLELIKSFRCTC